MLAEGANRILEGKSAVMYVDGKGEPSQKLVGMRDPQTGELLKNTFMLIKSGTFYDKEGTASGFSNMAFANIVMIPDAKLESARAPEVEVADTTAEQPAFDIDKVDWSLFQDNFKVHRSGGKIDESGWQLKDVQQDSNGVHKALITGWDAQKGGSVQKIVSLEQLVNWQKTDEQ